MAVLEKFYTQITGSEQSPKLVFLHGVMGFALNWRRIAKAFEDRFQVLIFDQRGHGRSIHPVEPYTPATYSSDLEGILDELGWSEIHLVGHSMGGRVALHFADRSPGRVTRLVIEDIGPGINNQASSLVIRMLDAVPVPFANKRVAKEWFDTQFSQIFAKEPSRDELAAFLYANIAENERKEAEWRFSERGVRESIAHGRSHDQWAEIRALRMPTLLVRGQHSRDLAREMFEEMLRASPKIVGAEIKDSGHWVHSDQPEKFIQVLSQFLADQKIASGPGIEAFGFDKKP